MGVGAMRMKMRSEKIMSDWNINLNNGNLAKTFNMMAGNLYETEWQGTTITVKIAPKRCELMIDGKTQDFKEGSFSSFTPENFILRGRNEAGDRIEVKLERKLLILSKFVFYFNGKYIYSADIK